MIRRHKLKWATGWTIIIMLMGVIALDTITIEIMADMAITMRCRR